MTSQLEAISAGTFLITALFSFLIGAAIREVGVKIFFVYMLLPTFIITTVAVASAFLISYGAGGFK